MRRSYKQCFLFFISILSLSSLCMAGDTITAWGTIKIEGHALGLNVTGAQITLECAPNPVTNIAWNKFSFNNVPTEEGCPLTIEIRSPTTGQNIIYRSSYKFRKAPFLAGVRGKKASGYLGDFLFNLTKNKI